MGFPVKSVVSKKCSAKGKYLIMLVSLYVAKALRMNKKSNAKVAASQESNKRLTITDGDRMKTTETLELLIN